MFIANRKHCVLHGGSQCWVDEAGLSVCNRKQRMFYWWSSSKGINCLSPLYSINERNNFRFCESLTDFAVDEDLYLLKTFWHPVLDMLLFNTLDPSLCLLAWCIFFIG
jgi:hypothetical protein